MQKIPTLFERNNRTGQVMDIISEFAPGYGTLSDRIATEKIDGANVRLTVRNETLVRLEARRNPSKDQKKLGIVDPWYRDAGDSSTSDRWLWEAASNTNLIGVPDGEWSGEAIGEKIQGNPLGIEGHRVILFSLIPWREFIPKTVELPHTFERVPLDFYDLAQWLNEAQTQVAGGSGRIEGLVWWSLDTPVAKIKRKDFYVDEKQEEASH